MNQESAKFMAKEMLTKNKIGVFINGFIVCASILGIVGFSMNLTANIALNIIMIACVALLGFNRIVLTIKNIKTIKNCALFLEMMRHAESKQQDSQNEKEDR